MGVCWWGYLVGCLLNVVVEEGLGECLWGAEERQEVLVGEVLVGELLRGVG